MYPVPRRCTSSSHPHITSMGVSQPSSIHMQTRCACTYPLAQPALERHSATTVRWAQLSHVCSLAPGRQVPATSSGSYARRAGAARARADLRVRLSAGSHHPIVKVTTGGTLQEPTLLPTCWPPAAQSIPPCCAVVEGPAAAGDRAGGGAGRGGSSVRRPRSDRRCERACSTAAARRCCSPLTGCGGAARAAACSASSTRRAATSFGKRLSVSCFRRGHTTAKGRVGELVCISVGRDCGESAFKKRVMPSWREAVGYAHARWAL